VAGTRSHRGRSARRGLSANRPGCLVTSLRRIRFWHSPERATQRDEVRHSTVDGGGSEPAGYDIPLLCLVVVWSLSLAGAMS
jgi:hypothetical protein